MNYTFLLVVAVALLVRATALSAGIEIRLQAPSNRSGFEIAVEGIPTEDIKFFASLPSQKLNEFFKLTFQENAGIAELPPVMGSMILNRDCLVFQPRFPLIADKSYLVEFVSPSTKIPTRQSVRVPPQPHREPTQVLAIYPTSSVLPRNVLKFYLHFSAPMQQGNVYQYLTLAKSDGTKLESPFLEVAEELWDPTGTRLTLLLDPGRVKQGLVPREEDGPVFEEGESYRFAIHSLWPDAHGQILATNTVKTFSIGHDDFDQPDPGNWKVSPPELLSAVQKGRGITSSETSSKAILRIDVPESLDHALFQRCITIINEQNKRVEGDIEIVNDEKAWLFKPKLDWEAGDYAIEIDDVIEDLAGNSIVRPFEVHTSDRSPRSKTVPITKLYFKISHRSSSAD